MNQSFDLKKKNFQQSSQISQQTIPFKRLVNATIPDTVTYEDTKESELKNKKEQTSNTLINSGNFDTITEMIPAPEEPKSANSRGNRFGLRKISFKKAEVKNLTLDFKKISSEGSNLNTINPTLTLPNLKSIPSSPISRIRIGDGETFEQLLSPKPPKISFFGKKSRRDAVVNNEATEKEEEYEQEEDEIIIRFPLFIINPYGLFRSIWDLFMIILIIYFCFGLPFRLCFSRIPEMFSRDSNTDWDDSWLPVDLICDLIIVADIVINLLTAYEGDHGIIVLSKLKIMKRYVKLWFIVDLASVFPINRHLFFYLTSSLLT